MLVHAVEGWFVRSRRPAGERAAMRVAAVSMSAAGQAQALAVLGAPDLVAVGPDGELGGDGDDGKLRGRGGRCR